MYFNADCKYSSLPAMCKKAVSYLNRDEIWRMTRIWNDSNSLFIDLIEECKEVGDRAADELTKVLNAIKNSINDRNKCAYVINDLLLPLLYSILDNSDNSVDINDEYTVSGSKSGFASLYDKRFGKYVNNSEDPLWEAMERADALLKPETQRIYILGAELGYLAYACWLATFKAAQIVVLDTEENIRTACDYGLLGRINEENIVLLCGDDYEELFEAFTTQDELTEFTAYYITQNIPIRAPKSGSMMQDFMNNQMLARAYEPRYAVNYWKNKKNSTGSLADFNEYIAKQGKESLLDECIVVAAGPSLADNIDFLKENKGKRFIIAISTAVRKLSAEGIKPDVVTILDPLPTVMPHLKGVGEFIKDVPLLLESVSYWEFTEKYPAPKFRVFATDYEKVLEEAGETNAEIWYGGSTVSVFAMEIAVKLGAKKVYLIGADFAYPGNKRYAHSESEDAVFETYVTSVDGNPVGSTENFKHFISDTEQVIKKYHGKVRFINKSRHGAYIKGAFSGKWWESIPTDPAGINEFLKNILEEKTFKWPERFFILEQAVTGSEMAGTLLDGACWENIAVTFEEIKKEFLCELSYDAASIQKKTGLILLLTTFFSEESDELTTKILEDAVTLRNKGKNVIILNSCEYLGGSPVAVENPVEVLYPEALAEKQDVVYKGVGFPYFQAPKGMPDADVIRSFLDMFSSSVPELVINYDPFSLMAAAFETITTVEHR